MGFYSDRILPRIIDFAMGMKHVAEERRILLGSVRGSVLEVGFGTGHNLPYYPSGVEKVVGVDPSGASARLAKKRIERSPFPVEFLSLPGEEIAAPDSSFDCVVCTFSLCTIPDPSAALAQMRRVLKPGGQFFFVEHGRSDDPKVQVWQDRLNGLQKRMCGGCNLNRQIDRLITDAGFEIDTLKKFYSKGPKSAAYFYRGVAHRAA